MPKTEMMEFDGSNDTEATPAAPKQVDYEAFVEAHEFGEYKQAAIDIASMLSLSELVVVGEKYDAQKTAEMRKKVFDAFCAICVRAGVELPTLEPCLYVPFAAEGGTTAGAEASASRSRIADIKQFVQGQIGSSEGEDAHAMRTIVDFFEVFPGSFDEDKSYSGVSTRALIAVLNKKLVAAGHQPVRPNYAQMDFKIANTERAPEKTVKVLVVDDRIEEIINTRLRLAGWPNVKIDHVLYKEDYRDRSPKEEKMSKVVEAIWAQPADVLIMDQELSEDVKGSEVLRVISGDERRGKMRFVANTGGLDKDLRAQGAYPNFEKGRNIEGVRAAILED